MIELATNAGKKEIKTIIEASKSLSLDDLQRTTAVIGEMNPDIGRQLQRVIKAKEKALERTGLKRNEIITSENLNPIISDVAERGSIETGEAASLSIAINETISAKIDDIASLEKVEAALAAIEKSEDFKSQKNGAMSKANAVVVKRKLDRVRAKLEGQTKKVKDKVKETVEKVKDVVTPVVETVVKKVKGVADKVDTVKISSTFRAVIDTVTDTLKDPKQAKILVDKSDLFIKQMKKFGIKTRAQFEAFVKQFPELENNIEFFKKLDVAYPSNISANEVFDIVKTKAVETVQKIKDAYNSMNPPACKL